MADSFLFYVKYRRGLRQLARQSADRLITRI
ncbi:hypothetical protein CCUG63695_03984 [Mycobacteroides franklinii]|uniref:Uncharacterized protein n=1 Tax=Mycobacteroides franklinii TaxID=948102 RepID=A0A4R8R4M3_9MYCO|nr:hypothetical protein CCUG64054_04057 [Mycobacteroides franklinii]TDZ51126.1 hypothetical protein CCUG63697_02642 [Mycobacteroides franklinii]TDZ57546.1 hypothetical protein CCUG63696_04053 [Mycobacteroides franklinii]TDZ64488.1 hypothetical protein CCUG63695_03984 [Mycobacteroides franklinii]TDZ70885.1 hypothetical protein CCUG64056_04057 [Mycobacteroides franklinii]